MPPRDNVFSGYTGILFLIRKRNKNTLKCIIWNDFLHISLLFAQKICTFAAELEMIKEL